MKVAVVLTTYNRPNYLHQCLESLKKVRWIPDSTIVIMDDMSTDDLAIQLIKKFSIESISIHKWLNNQKYHIYGSLKNACDYAFNLKSDLVINLDADALASPCFLEKAIELHERFPNNICSLFNTLSCDHVTKLPRHPIIKDGEDYVIKHSIGGINMIFNKELYQRFIRPNLVMYGWDWAMCESVKNNGEHFVVSKLSYVDHIGYISSISSIHNMNPDVAVNFQN